MGLFVQPLLPSPLHNTTGSFDVGANDGRAVGFFVGFLVVVGIDDGSDEVGFFVQPLLPSPLHNTTGSFVVGAIDGRAVGFFDVGAVDGRAVGFFVVGADDGRAVGAGVGLVLVVGLIVGDAVYVIPISGHSDGSGLIPVYALFTYLSRFVTLSYMLSQTTTPLESMT